MSLPFLVKSNLNKTYKNESPSCPLANDHRLTQRMDLYIPRPLVSGWNAQLRTLHNFARADALDRPRPLLSFAVDSTNFTGNWRMVQRENPRLNSLPSMPGLSRQPKLVGWAAASLRVHYDYSDARWSQAATHRVDHGLLIRGTGRLTVFDWACYDNLHGVAWSRITDEHVHEIWVWSQVQGDRWSVRKADSDGQRNRPLQKRSFKKR